MDIETNKPNPISPIPSVEHLPINPNIITNFADIAHVSVRKDGMCMISFFSRIPDINQEQCRIVIQPTLVKGLCELLCKSIKYYPKPPEASEKPEAPEKRKPQVKPKLRVNVKKRVKPKPRLKLRRTINLRP